MVRHITLFLWFTAELNAQMDELEALLAATARNNNDNATQNGNYYSTFSHKWYVCNVLVYNIMEHVYYVT